MQIRQVDIAVSCHRRCIDQGCAIGRHREPRPQECSAIGVLFIPAEQPMRPTKIQTHGVRPEADQRGRNSWLNLNSDARQQSQKQEHRQRATEGAAAEQAGPAELVQAAEGLRRKLLPRHQQNERCRQRDEPDNVRQLQYGFTEQAQKQGGDAAGRQSG